ncbi:MAG: DNA polymerase III subunit gamma/tau, partial [Microcystaceae cyanobacterium]
MYAPLHHKYRPQTFAELVGQDAIAATLTNAITSQRLAPAYLFTGPRGTGKTSSARILAKSLNCLNEGQPTPNPCGQCASCQAVTSGSSLDVIEIDAASNSGVEQVRDLIEKCQFSPLLGRLKVFIIDEVHAITGAAAQALLKTLEEPPAHVIFILCTTEPQKLPNTILSRCQRFNFRRLGLDAMVNHLQAIATAEKIPITEEAIRLVAQIANGGLRDAQTLLDQLSLLEGSIAPRQVWALVGTVPEAELLELMQAIASDEPQTVIKWVRNLLDQGKEPLIVLQNLTEFYTNLLIAKTSPNSQELINVTEGIWEKLKEVADTLEVTTILTGQQHL